MSSYEITLKRKIQKDQSYKLTSYFANQPYSKDKIK